MNEKQAIRILKKHAPNQRVFKIVLEHSKAVQNVALRIAEEIKDVDREFIRAASLLHDIGRFKFPPSSGAKAIRHGIAGAEILRKEGLDESFAKVCERHIGAGISKENIREQKLDLPPADYTPQTKEEKIIAHADNLIFCAREASIEKVARRFRKEVNEKAAQKIIALNNEIENFKKKPRN